ncbi:hypothetical protein RhiirC2_782770 [Rhizophagus irregularis]|uniref:DUF8211 domain-containing protein n=1 Tax=Rhizophagus irregularis TaxID=588596 RepID=A0A2N1N2E0_9GLOM|nr:hypothetical protein RhiirC2_782770 [Rhizophagus irregularis]
MICKKLLERVTFIQSCEDKSNNQNTSTKTFFNFSYKKYRFYFGIFIPYDHSIESKPLSLPPRLCDLPSPIAMFNNRHGCGLHFYKKYQEKTIFVRNNNGELVSPNHLQNKQLHANLIYERWKNKETKSISSLHTGITYNSRYIISNRQQKRFERSCRRILKQEIIKPGAVSNVSSKLATAKKNGFVFLSSQKITKSIKHLHYKKVNDIPNQKDYNFIIPQYFRTERKKVTPPIVVHPRITVNVDVLESTTNNQTILSASPYNPIPNMFIPVKYHDIIMPDPIYDDADSFIIPGSRAWFTYMYRLDLATREERLEKAEMARMAARYAELEAESEARIAHQLQLEEERTQRLAKIRKDHEIELNKEAIYQGTSSKHVEHRR